MDYATLNGQRSGTNEYPQAWKELNHHLPSVQKNWTIMSCRTEVDMFSTQVFLLFISCHLNNQQEKRSGWNVTELNNSTIFSDFGCNSSWYLGWKFCLRKTIESLPFWKNWLFVCTNNQFSLLISNRCLVHNVKRPNRYHHVNTPAWNFVFFRNCQIFLFYFLMDIWAC